MCGTFAGIWMCGRFAGSRTESEIVGPLALSECSAESEASLSSILVLLFGHAVEESLLFWAFISEENDKQG